MGAGTGDARRVARQAFPRARQHQVFKHHLPSPASAMEPFKIQNLTGSFAIKLYAADQSPDSSERVAAMMWSRTDSGGPCFLGGGPRGRGEGG